jgi:hypothetical protein
MRYFLAVVALVIWIGVTYVRGEMADQEYMRIVTSLGERHPVNLALDGKALSFDALVLGSSGSECASREVGSEGSKCAQGYIARRYAQIGLGAFGTGYARPFSFTFYDGPGLYLPKRRFKTVYSNAVNLVGFIKGSQYPDRFIVVTARFDTHEDPGIIWPTRWENNGTGLAAMLSMADYLKKHPPRHSIVFAALDGGERGQAGARAFLEDPPFPVEQIWVNLNLDIVGSDHLHHVYVAGTYHTPQLLPAVEAAAYWSSPGVRVGHDRPAWRSGSFEDWTQVSDHREFHARGIPFLFVGAENFDDAADTHQPWNGVSTVSFLATLMTELDQNLEKLPIRK